ncbi:NAD(P)-binding protein [Suhomyces tanzawaensis NRRL Y-17324]|uniref:NAD(P)-binding protein n=1 Tax=Suhomyces tanzawaensis NRRL Y-17324 TaxID=984487 RepID=A0A1E4SEZ0_9ASCO|nr:NAD(P)-binding protein [Suhomyces tanzawaensis NRRL Y-17324]ODV78050.1 NAD(P)-binding protein [Suhomyces tanzawaensis NRRL Y-17324]
MSVPTTINAVLLKNAPTGEVQFDYSAKDATFELSSKPFSESDLKDGFVLVKNLYFSNDPAQRGWIAAGQDASRGYADPVKEGDAIRSSGFGEIVASKSSKYSVGDKVLALLTWSDYQPLHEAAVFQKVDESEGVTAPVYLSALGYTAFTAYFGLKDILQLKEGQTIVVSAAAGATGSMVVQLAKHVFKAGKVIGLAGSDEKSRWIESLGADVGINYNDADYKEQLDKAIGPDCTDAYFDNVGGDMLSFLLTKVKKFGRVAACGAIAGYNDKSKLNVTTWTQIITNSLTVQGFVIFNYVQRFPEAIEVILGGISKGTIKVENTYHIEDLSKEEKPLAKVPEVWSLLFGSNKPNGKLITKIA